MNEELLRLLQGLDKRFEDADKTSKYFSSNPEKYDIAVDMLRQKYKPEADSAKFRSYIDGKYGNPFAEQQAPEVVADEPAMAQEQIPAAEPVQEPAMEQGLNPMQQGLADAYLGNGQLLSEQPNLLPEVQVEASGMPEGTVEGAMQSYAPGAAPQGLGLENMPIAQQADQEPLADLHWTGDVKNTVGAFNHAILNTLPAFSETIAATANKIDDTIGPENDKKTEDYATYKAAEWMRGKIKELLPVDEAYQQELAPQIAGGLGQVATIMLAAGTGNAPAALEQLGAKSPALLPAITDAAAKLSSAMLSKGGAVAGTQVFANEFREAKQAGADDDTAFESGVKNAIVSSGLEQLPVLNALKRFNSATKGGVVNWLKNTTVEASEEMVTEVASQFYANLNAQQTYDESRSLMEGLKESGEVGYGTGFILNGVLNALGVKMRNAKTVEEKKLIKTAMDEAMVELETAADPATLLDEQGRPYTIRQEADGKETKVYKLEEDDTDKPSGGGKSTSRLGSDVYLAADVEGTSQQKRKLKDGTERPYTVTENEPTFIKEAGAADPEPAGQSGEVADAGDGVDSRPEETAAAQPEATGVEPEVPGAEPDHQADRELVADSKTTYVTPYIDGVMEAPQSEQEKLFIVDESTGTFRVNPDQVDLFLNSVDTDDYVSGKLSGKDAKQVALAMTGRLEKSGKGWKVAEKLNKPKPEPATPVQGTEVKPTPVKPFAQGDGGTKGIFEDESGKLYKSVQPMRMAQTDKGFERQVVEGAVTKEHEILTDLQGNPHVPVVGPITETSEGPAFEIEKLEEIERLTLDDYWQAEKILEGINNQGYFVNDKVTFMRRPKTGELVVVDFSTGLKDKSLIGNFSYADTNSMSDVAAKLSKKDQVKLSEEKEARHERKLEELFNGRKKKKEASEPAPVQGTETFTENEQAPVAEQPSVKESFTVGNAAYSVEKDGDSYTVTNTGTGKVLTNPKAANYKSAVKQFEGKREAERQQQKRNSIVGSVQALNDQLKGTKPQEQKARKRFVALSAEADKAGLDLRENKKQGRFELFDKKTGKKVSVKNTDTPTSINPKAVSLASRSQEVQDFVGKAIPKIKDNPVVMQNMGLSFHRDSDIRGAVADIEAGKNTNRANELLDKMEQAVKQGFIGREVNVGGGRYERGTESLSDFLGEGSMPLSSLDDDALARLLDSDKGFSTIVDESGSLNPDGSINYENLQNYIDFMGEETFIGSFPYNITQDEFNEFKALIDERKTKQPQEADPAAADNISPEPAQADGGSQSESQAQEVVVEKTPSKGKKVSFTYHDGTKRVGTVTERNEDGTLNIKGENGRNYPNVDTKSIDADLPAQTARLFAPVGVTMPALSGSSSGRIQPSPIIGERPKPLREIMLDMSLATKGKVSYSKRPGGRRALGTYNPRNAALKIRYRNDLDTTAHELGHSLDDEYGILEGIPQHLEQDIHAELMDLAPGGSTPPAGHPDPQKYSLGEGVAEYIRGYIVNPDEARRRAPEFTAWYESAVPAKTRKRIDGFSEDIRVFIGSSAHDAIMANVEMEAEPGRSSFFSAPGAGEFGLTWFDRLVTAWADSLQPLKKSILFARAERGLGALRPSKDPYILAENLAGHNDKLSRIFESGLVDAKLQVVNDQVTGKPMTMRWLFEGLDSSDKTTLEREQQEVVSYMVAERTLELIDKRIEQDIDAALNEGKYVDDAILNANPRFQALVPRNQANRGKLAGKVLQLLDKRDEKKQAVTDNYDGQISNWNNFLSEKLDAIRQAKSDKDIAIANEAALRALDAYDKAQGISTDSKRVINQVRSLLSAANKGTTKADKKANRALSTAEINGITGIVNERIKGLERVKKVKLRNLDQEYERLIAPLESSRNIARINTSDAAIVTGIGGGIIKDTDQARRRLDEMEQLRQNNPDKHTRIKEAARRYQAYADQVLQYAVDKGRMSQEQYDAIKRYNTQYVALNRILEAGPEEEIVVHQGNGSSLASAKGVADKKVKGSGATIKNPYVSLLDFVNKTVEESDRNEFKLAFRDLFKGDREMYSGEQEALAQVARIAAQGDKNTIKIFVDGKAEYWQLQEDVYKAFTGFDEAGNSSYLVQALSPIAGMVRWTVTHSPVFALRNKVRDMQNWLVISKSGPHRAFSFNRATKAENRRKYELFGGGQGGYYLKDENFYYTQMELAMEEMAKSKNFILANPQRLLSRGWEKYKSLLSESETSTRLLEFNAAFKKAKQKGLDDYDAATIAAHEARDLMNFARAGNIAREVNKVIPFLNAAIQGLRKTLRTAKDNPGGMMVRWAAFLAVPAVLNRMLIASFGEDEEEEYQKMPAYQRDLFYNFPIGDNKWLAIPKPFEIGVLASGVERLLDKAYYGNEKAFEGYAGSVARTTMPIDESAIAGPLRSLVEVSANYDFFKQKAIVSPYERDKAVELRKGTERASALGKLMQQAVGNTIDARYIDHLISANTTYFGNWTMKLSDEIAGTENNAKGFNLSDTGFIKQDPVYNSRDVQWVMAQAKELGLAQSKDMRELNRLLGEQFEAEEARDKEAKGKVVREYAGRLRAYWESSNAEATVKGGEKVKKMPKPTAAK